MTDSQHKKPEKGQKWTHRQMGGTMEVVAADLSMVRLRNVQTGFYMSPMLVDQLWEHFRPVE